MFKQLSFKDMACVALLLDEEAGKKRSNLIAAIDVGSYGKGNGRGIFPKSHLGKPLENKTIHVPEDVELSGTNEKFPYVIVEDEPVPLKPY
jgi:hypothetical protein